MAINLNALEKCVQRCFFSSLFYVVVAASDAAAAAVVAIVVGAFGFHLSGTHC